MARIGLYQPFIEDRNVRRLYRLKVAYREEGRKVPMTTLINRILDDFFADARRPNILPHAAAASGVETP